MKTIQEIKDEVAKDNGYNNWRHIVEHDAERLYIDLCMERYAEQFIEKDCVNCINYNNGIGKKICKNCFNYESFKLKYHLTNNK